MNTIDAVCPICGPRSREVLLWQKNRCCYVRCLSCGMIYINPQLSDENVARIYSQTLYDQKSERLDLLLPTLHRYKFRLLRRFEPFRKIGTLLDVGCFKGFFLYSAACRGWQTMGTEVSQPAVRFAREKLGQQVALGDLPSLSQLQGRQFDVITFFDVIEHLSRPDLYIQRSLRLLRPGGLLYMETPNLWALPRYLWGKRWTVFNSLHRYYFQPTTMGRFLGRMGFHRVRIRTVGFFPLGTRGDEPGCSRSPSRSQWLCHVPIDTVRAVKDIVEAVIFYPLDNLGFKVGTKMVVWAQKGA